MAHLRRAVALLLVPVVVGIALPWVLKNLSARTEAGLIAEVPPSVLVPASFGEHGYYRGSNVHEWTSLAPRFAGDTTVCATCHQSQSRSWSRGAHQGVSCQTCHGTRASHVEGKPEPYPAARELAPLTAPAPGKLCSLCHDAGVVGRPAGFPQVIPEIHSRGLTCTLCHNPHDPKPGGGR